MKKYNLSFLILNIFLVVNLPLKAQINEPDFVGESYLLKTDGSFSQLDKAIGNFTSGLSFSSNSFNALSLEIDGGKAQARFSSGEPLQLIVRAVDNDSDPLSIITIYKFKAKKSTRSVLISKDNSGTLMKSRTSSKDIVLFNGGKKYGTSSYLITLKGLATGEYGIIVSNPNSKDEKRVVVSCFAID
ncbi:hypothetical protein [Persicitalea jodogahamensis]|uniref:Uncharacterized protein n=1 Tax=Persicitalea jodogahamensis TaxID=402147 RepID=A0A8J3G922_9BACT|nr:hypothetical protein [Persicitalea jodogahamensis]GHB69803.1 hypothetical protein GCM10007390_24280 [Persicitalea jodogahamensis]